MLSTQIVLLRGVKSIVISVESLQRHSNLFRLFFRGDMWKIRHLELNKFLVIISVYYICMLEYPNKIVKTLTFRHPLYCILLLWNCISVFNLIWQWNRIYKICPAILSKVLIVNIFKQIMKKIPTHTPNLIRIIAKFIWTVTVIK